MVYSAIKRSREETTYQRHYYVDDDPRGGFIYGRFYRPGGYIPGDLICLDRRDMRVTEVFWGWDFHTGKQVRCFDAIKDDSIDSSVWRMNEQESLRAAYEWQLTHDV